MSGAAGPESDAGAPEGSGWSDDAGWVSAQVLSGIASRGEDAGAAAESFAVPPELRYVDRNLLGMGGMGRVVAVHDRRLCREVAMKSPRTDGAGAERLGARLVREALVTARIDHPGVVPILDAGVAPDGRVFYTMPIVRGQSLAELIAPALGAESRMRLLRRVLEAVEAVAAAHRAGIVHGDLKPANIMLGDGGGTRVLDWGLARVLEEPPPAGEVAGTPQYMSPEQARGEPVDARSDVWALGAILYEVVSGSPLRASVGASELLAQARQNARPDISKIEGMAPAELRSIIARALAACMDERYADAGALASDLASHLDGRRVGAYEYSARELLLRFIRAWRVPLTVAAIAIVVIVVMTWIGVARLGDEARRSTLAAERASQAEVLAREALGAASRDLTRSLLSQARLASDRGARAEAELLAAHALLEGESPIARGVVATWSAAPPPEFIGRWELPDCLGISIDAAGPAVLCREAGALSLWSVGVTALELRWRQTIPSRSAHHSGAWVASFESANVVSFIDADSGRVRMRGSSACERDVRVLGPMSFSWSNGCFNVSNHEVAMSMMIGYPCVGHGIMGAFAPLGRGERWAALCEDGLLVRGGLEVEPERWSRVQTALLRSAPALSLAELVVDGREHLVAGTSDGRVVVIEPHSGRVVGSVLSGFDKVSEVVALSDGLVLARSPPGEIALIDPAEGLLRGRFPETGTRAVGADGSLVLVAARDLRAYRVGRRAVSAVPLEAGVTSVAFSPDGTLLAVTLGDRFEVRRVSDGKVVGRGDAREDFIKGGVFSVDGEAFFLATTKRRPSRDWTSRAWSPLDWRELPTTELELHVRRVETAVGGTVLTLPYMGGVLAFEPWHADRQIMLVDSTQRFADLEASDSGRFAAAIGEDDGLIVRIELPAHTVTPVATWRRATAVAISEDGDLVVGAGDGGAWWWDAETGRMTAEIPTPGLVLVEVDVSPDHRWVAAGARDGQIFVWEYPSGRLVAWFHAQRDRIASLDFSPDGRVLASGSWDGTVRILDVTRFEPEARALISELEAVWGTTHLEILGD